MVSETDEAAGLSPGNEENEADRCDMYPEFWTHKKLN